MDAVAAGKKLPYTWNPGHQARVGLLPRDGSAGDVRWFEVDPCWVFHTLNAYDDGGRVVLDLCRYQGAYDVSALDGRGPADAGPLDRSTRPPGRSPSSASTTGARNSPASTTGSSPGRTATATAR